MTLAQLLGEKREEILRIAAQHGATNVRIFGSVARGEAGPGSDIDFLVDAGPGRSAFFPAGLLADLEDLLGCRVDVLTENGLHWYIRDRVLKEAVSLSGGGSMETITLHSRVGADGLLKLQVPVKATNTELEVVLIVQPVAPASQVPGWPPEFFKEVAGGWQGEPLLREEQGPYEVREDLE